MSSFSFSDEETKAFLREVYLHRKYLLDPHGAVAYGALKKYMTQHAGSRGIFLETAHPVKFYDIVESVIGQDMPIPALINDLLKLKKQSIQMDVKYESFKHYLLSA